MSSTAIVGILQFKFFDQGINNYTYLQNAAVRGGPPTNNFRKT